MPKMMQIACMNSCASGITVEAAEMSILNYFQNENSDMSSSSFRGLCFSF